ncbi:MAG: hypothetical protein U9P14_01090, partial [Gemmatimonadota bacterium]|nr:hypothetical protein [Gemmatimonadota bacterium]
VRKSEKKIEVTTKYPKGKKWFSFDMKDDNFLEDPNAGLLKSLVHKLNSFWDGLTASIDRAVKVTVDYEIKLPWDTGVKLNNVNGDVWIVEIEGGQEINIVNGDLRLVRSGGRVEANLVSGKLEIIDATGSVEVNNINGPIYAGLGGGADADFNTVNGDITISVPDSAALDFRLTTLSGSVEVGLPVELKRKSTGKKLAARLNGGGPLIDANAVNGDILVKKK